jgi:hypothetical protein
MIPGIYILRPGEVETTRRFETMWEASAVIKRGDQVFLIGPDGLEIIRWTKSEAGLLVVIKKDESTPGAPMGPRSREVRERFRWPRARRGYIPPPGGRGADGRPRVWPKPADQSDPVGAGIGLETPVSLAPARPPAVSCTSRREDDTFPKPPAT